ncbi:succinylglutamate desuccinylase/aspartoacylase family protein [Mesobacterium sp. TK19101]|uniref:Succinylglutamate desuccinylase/aspartoacylase family protein n=1 Tax=Mesobacterium hydrothermale TaxID=3111907 RepID=A0ABU6HH20_9RHOB|nr:succinylglutamate desuccinylase/aspartoacylase family protein [Mesobacterium sp. TK19101]MEC3861754.1 succinylglutamate desuccinylase/aspartoacylase family protein [Mesobacterium sp. TK19101]
MHAPDFSASRLLPGVDLTAPGKRAGQIGLLHSDNDNPLGVYPIPAMCIVGGVGPTVLLLAGVHGDEYEGPAALTRLYQALEPSDVTGRLIFLPQLNAPACTAGTRVSPLDGGNLNRAFPGAADGGPTAQIAHMVSACLMPVCDAVIDLHSGGKASWFVPCALAARGRDGAPDVANMALARAFRADVIWQLGAANDDRSVNGAATAHGIPCIAAELGGGGYVGIDALQIGEAGVRHALIQLGVLQGKVPEAMPRVVELSAPGHRVTAPVAGVYLPARAAGEDIAAGERLGQIVTPAQPDAAPTEIRAETSGLILAETRRAAVVPGAFLAFIAGAA